MDIGLRIGTQLAAHHLEIVRHRTCRTYLHELVNNPRFEGVFGGLILLNSVFIGVEVEHSAPAGHPQILSIMVGQYMFNLCFLVEICLRIGAYGKDFFTSHASFVWNYLDLVLVTSSVVETVGDIAAAAMGSATEGAGSLNHIRMLRVVRIARLVRMMRVARVVRFVRALRVLLHSIMTTMKSLMWVLLLVVLVVYFFGVIFTQSARDTLNEIGKDPTDVFSSMDEDTVSLLRLYWESLPRSMLTLFKVLTNGVDWELVQNPLGRIHPALVFVFIAFVSFVTFTLLNVVTGVFCQSAIEGAQYDKELFVQELLANKQLYIQQACDLFANCFDKVAARDGLVTFEAFEDHLNDSAVQAYFALLDMDASDAFTLFKMLDSEQDETEAGGIDAAEFVEGCLRFKGHARSIDLMKLTYENRWLIKQFADFTDETRGHLDSLFRAFSAINGSRGLAQAIPGVADAQTDAKAAMPGLSPTSFGVAPGTLLPPLDDPSLEDMSEHSHA